MKGPNDSTRIYAQILDGERERKQSWLLQSNDQWLGTDPPTPYQNLAKFDDELVYVRQD